MTDVSIAGPRLTSLANLLGIARIALTPVVIALLLLPFPGGGLLAFFVFVVAAATDYLDGRVARARGQVSPLGVFMDLTADKVLVAGVLIAMVEVRLLPTWMVATILIREFVIQGVRQLAAAADVVIPARALGKAKTLATLAGMALLLLAHDARTGGPTHALLPEISIGVAGFWLMVVATGLTVVSAVDYVIGAFPLLMGRGDA
ncbi:MAG: CDP-diacylglycerol--glycerol-3-phosphate 3-phosphatidyltransferase [Chloroflexi bacterium]|nr:MAG: CDP-diacylglycerol--glycerol-3-phosphate 3-phosphatidyltransferase [Chloroflexota bacterium]